MNSTEMFKDLGYNIIVDSQARRTLKKMADENSHIIYWISFDKNERCVRLWKTKDCKPRPVELFEIDEKLFHAMEQYIQELDEWNKVKNRIETIEFRGYEWIVLQRNNGKVKLLLKNVLDGQTISYCRLDKWYFDGYEVKFASTMKPPLKWKHSYMKTVILENFKRLLDVDCTVDLLSKKDIEKLDKDIVCCGASYWTKDIDNDSEFVKITAVTSYGTIDDDAAFHYCGVRPVIVINVDDLEKGDK